MVVSVGSVGTNYVLTLYISQCYEIVGWLSV